MTMKIIGLIMRWMRNISRCGRRRWRRTLEFIVLNGWQTSPGTDASSSDRLILNATGPSFSEYFRYEAVGRPLGLAGIIVCDHLHPLRSFMAHLIRTSEGGAHRDEIIRSTKPISPRFPLDIRSRMVATPAGQRRHWEAFVVGPSATQHCQSGRLCWWSYRG